MKPPGGALAAAAPQILLLKMSKFIIPDGGFAVSCVFNVAVMLKAPRQRRFYLKVSCSSANSDGRTASSQYSSQFGDLASESRAGIESLNFEVGSPSSPLNLIPRPRLSLGDQAFLLLAFLGCTTSIAFTCLVAAAVPTLFAMRRAAISLSKLADTAREELPSTMAAIRLSGMEISDLTLELSDLSQEIADGVNKSAQAVQAAEAGVRRIGSLAREQTMGAAMKTSRAVGWAAKSFLNIISLGEHNSADEYDGPMDRTS